MTLKRTDDDDDGVVGTGTVVVGSSSSGGSSDGGSTIGPNRITLKRKRGRPRSPGVDPTVELATMRRSGTGSALQPSSPSPATPRRRKQTELPVSGIDSYLDADYLMEERRRRYRPEDFHIAIKNESDHEGTPVKIRRHPLMEAAMNEMVNSNEFHFKSAQDIYNVGAFELMRKLYHLRQCGGLPLTNWQSQLKTQSDMIYMAEQSAEFNLVLERLRKTVQGLEHRHGKFGRRQAAVLVVQVQNEAKRMRDTAWGNWYLEQIEEEFGELVRSQEQRVRIRRGE